MVVCKIMPDLYNYFEYCLLYREANAYSLMWQSQLNLGDMLLRQGKHERAQAAFKNSLQHGMGGNNKQHQAESLIQLAMVMCSLMIDVY